MMTYKTKNVFTLNNYLNSILYLKNIMPKKRFKYIEIRAIEKTLLD